MEGMKNDEEAVVVECSSDDENYEEYSWPQTYRYLLTIPIYTLIWFGLVWFLFVCRLSLSPTF